MNKRHHQPTLTVVVIVKNEVKNLAGCLKSLTIANEVIVIDDYSTDDTLKVAKLAGARVYQRALDGDYAAQRNFGLDKARSEWVLFLDADERLTPMALKAVRAAIKAGNEIDGYQLRRLDVFLGKTLKYGETGSIWLTRLGRRNSGRWRRPVHETWDLKKVVKLAGVIEHRSHENFSALLATVNQYAQLEAKYRAKQGQDWSLWETIVNPVGKWIVNVIFKRGILDGWPGLLMATGMSYHSLRVRTNLYRIVYNHKQTNTVIARWWRLSLWLMLISLMLGQWGRITLGPVIATYSYELIILIQLGLVGTGLYKYRQVVTWPSYTRPGLVLFLIMVFSLGVNLDKLGPAIGLASLYAIRWGLYTVWWLSLWLAKQMKWLALPYQRLLIWLGAVWAGVGLVQYLVFPDTRWLYRFGWDEHYYRVIGLLYDPGFLGGLLVLGLILWEFVKGPRWRWWYGLSLGALLLTYSRASYLAYFLAVGLIGWQKRSVKLSLTRWALLIGLILILPRPGGEGVRLERTRSLESRVQSNQVAWALFKQSPVYGIGFNAYRAYVPQTHPQDLPVHPSGPDNSWWLILATMGLIGLGVTGWWFISLIKMHQHHPAVWISLIVVGAHALTNNSLFYGFILIWLGLLVNDEPPDHLV